MKIVPVFAKKNLFALFTDIQEYMYLYSLESIATVPGHITKLSVVLAYLNDRLIEMRVAAHF